VLPSGLVKVESRGGGDDVPEAAAVVEAVGSMISTGSDVVEAVPPLSLPMSLVPALSERSFWLF